MTTWQRRQLARVTSRTLRLGTTYLFGEPIVDDDPASADYGRLFLGDGVTPGGNGLSFLSDAPPLAGYQTVTQVQAATIPSSVSSILVAGYAVPGDNGAARWKRTSAPNPVRLWHVKSADGAWWQLDMAGEFVRPQMFGTWAIDCHDCFQAAIDYHSTLYGLAPLVRIPQGYYYLGSGLTCPYPDSRIVGDGSNRTFIEMGKNDGTTYTSPMLEIGQFAVDNKPVVGAGIFYFSGLYFLVKSEGHVYGGASENNGGFYDAVNFTSQGLRNRILGGGSATAPGSGRNLRIIGAGSGWRMTDVKTARNNVGIELHGCVYGTMENCETYGIWDESLGGFQETYAGIFIPKNTIGVVTTKPEFLNCRFFGSIGMPTASTPRTFGSSTVTTAVNNGPRFGIWIQEAEEISITNSYLGGNAEHCVYIDPQSICKGFSLCNNLWDASSLGTIYVKGNSGQYLNGLYIRGSQAADGDFVDSAFLIVEPPGSGNASDRTLSNLHISDIVFAGFWQSILQLNGVDGGLISSCSFAGANCLNGYTDDAHTCGIILLGGCKYVHIANNVFGGSVNVPSDGSNFGNGMKWGLLDTTANGLNSQFGNRALTLGVAGGGKTNLGSMAA